MAQTFDRYAGIAGAPVAPAGEPGSDRRPVSGLVAFGFVAAVAVSIWAAMQAIWWIAPGELIWPISPDVDAAAVFVGVLILVLAAARVFANRSICATDGRARRGRLDALLGGPVLLYMAMAGMTQIAVQVVGFAGLRPTKVAVPFAVVGIDEKRTRSGSRHYLLRLRYGAYGRVFDDPVPQTVHDAAAVGDTVMRPVETGRFGLQRAMVATPLAVADLHHE